MTRQYRSDPPATIAASIPREPGKSSDLSRTVQVMLAMESYRANAALFGAVRAALESKP